MDKLKLNVNMSVCLAVPHSGLWDQLQGAAALHSPSRHLDAAC